MDNMDILGFGGVGDTQLPSYRLEKLRTAHELVRVCRDFHVGAAKVLNSRYLKKWERETDNGYLSRVDSTVFPNFFASIVQGLTGIITKKEVVVNGYDYDSFYLDNIDLKGNSLANFVKMVCESALVGGVEFVSVETSVTEKRPFLKRYLYEQLVSYQVEEGQLIQMVFREELEEPEGLFGSKKIERYIVFKQGGGEVWYNKGDGLRIWEEWTNQLDSLPVVAIKTGRELSFLEIVPILHDVAILNKVLLNLETQSANALSVASNPIPVFWGSIADNGVAIGTKDALVFENKQTQGFEYVEASGEGITAIQQKIIKVNQDIDRMSFAFLSRDGSRTVVDAQENQTKASSFLSNVAIELEDKFNQLFEFIGEIDNKRVDGFLSFKKDFDDILFSDSQLNLLYAMVIEGNLSRETFWEKLKINNILDKSFDIELEEDRIKEEGNF